MARAIDAGTLQDNLTNIYGDGNRPVYLKDVLDLIDEQPTLTPQSEWVSVEERLPEPTYCVLVYTTDYSIEVDARGSDGEWMSYEVTHWMPLPSPPDRRPPEGEEDI